MHIFSYIFPSVLLLSVSISSFAQQPKWDKQKIKRDNPTYESNTTGTLSWKCGGQVATECENSSKKILQKAGCILSYTLCNATEKGVMCIATSSNCWSKEESACASGKKLVNLSPPLDAETKAVCMREANAANQNGAEVQQNKVNGAQ